MRLEQEPEPLTTTAFGGGVAAETMSYAGIGAALIVAAQEKGQTRRV